MSVNLKDYMDAIYTRLTAVQGREGEILNGVSIVREDSADVGTQIDEAVDKTGMLIIIGIPRYDNTGQSKHSAVLGASAEIAIQEQPTLWRDGPPNTKPVCLDVEKRVRELLQAYLVPGFQPMQVQAGVPIAGRKSQVFSMKVETQFVQQKSNIDGT